MRIIEKMAKKQNDCFNNEGVTIAFLGDSVTQGCFEIFRKENGSIETFFDKRNSYEMFVFDILCTLYPACTVNIINAGISGDRAPHGFERLERDVLRHQPDLCVVCYGLNDCSASENSIKKYTDALRSIFDALQSKDIETIFLTPNMMNTRVSPNLAREDFQPLAVRIADMQNNGLFDSHIDAARALCTEMGVTVCDCYAIWKALDKNGVDITELLANKINHPTPEMNRMFAYELVKTMFEN